MKTRNSLLPIVIKWFGLLAVLALQTNSFAQTLYRCEIKGRVLYQDLPCEDSVAAQREVVLEEAAIAETDLPGSRGNGWLWRAERGGRVVYMTGSIHFGTEDIYPLPAPVMNAFSSSDVLMVEADILNLDQRQINQIILSRGILSDGSTLKNHVSEATWEQLLGALETLNIPETVVLGQKPWLAAMTLGALGAQAAGMDPELGVDRHFLQLADGVQRVVELEGIDHQIGLLDDMPDAVQAVLLRQTLDDLQQGGEKFSEIIQVWKAGDVLQLEELIAREFNRESTEERLTELLLAKRNRNMVARIQDESRQQGNYFVVVGAAHLVGEYGLPALLAEAGFSVERVGLSN